MGLNTRGETEQVRKPKQTHTKTTTKRNHQPAATRKTKAPNVYVSPALSTRGRRRNPGKIEQRRACGGVAKREGLPDHQNQRRLARKSKKDSEVTGQHGQVPGTQEQKGKVQIGQLSQRRGKPARAPRWSASGAVPSNSQHNLRLYYQSDHIPKCAQASQGGSLRVAAATDSKGKDYQTAVKPSLKPAAKERPARAPWWSASGNLTVHASKVLTVAQVH